MGVARLASMGSAAQVSSFFCRRPSAERCDCSEHRPRLYSHSLARRPSRGSEESSAVAAPRCLSTQYCALEFQNGTPTRQVGRMLIFLPVSLQTCTGGLKT